MTSDSPASPGRPQVPSPAALAKKRGVPGTGTAAHHVHHDPSNWGRISEDGKVYRRNADGTETLVGAWLSGDPAEGIRHYGNRYLDLITEVEMAERRLETHPEDSEANRFIAEQLKDSLAEAAVFGDIAPLSARLDTVIANAGSVADGAKAQREQMRQEARAKKRALIQEAHELAGNTSNFKKSGARFRAMTDQWRSIKGLGRKEDDELWAEFAAARKEHNARRDEFFSDLDAKRAKSQRVKERLISRAEALQDSTDWGNTARAFHELMDEWRAAGAAPRAVDDELWERFSKARSRFFDARDELNREREREFEANAEKKQALIDHYDPLITPEQDYPAAKRLLTELQDKWEEIGYVPRGRVREFEDKITALEKRVKNAEDAEWRRTDPEAQARAAQFEQKAREFREQAHNSQGTQAEALFQQAEQWEQFAEAARKAVQDL